MTTTAQTGTFGERAATDYLRQRGYDIRALNWRSGRHELDIIAYKTGVLHFVEVKTRRAGGLTPPEAAITPAKFRALQQAALHYLALTKDPCEIQFDLAAVDMLPDGSAEVRFIECAMESNW